MKEGGRVLARQAAERQADERRPAQARSAQIAVTAAGSAHVGTAAPGCPDRAATATSATVGAGKVHVGTAAPGRPGREATVTTERKPPLGVKPAPKERKISAPSASAG